MSWICICMLCRCIWGRARRATWKVWGYWWAVMGILGSSWLLTPFFLAFTTWTSKRFEVGSMRPGCFLTLVSALLEDWQLTIAILISSWHFLYIKRTSKELPPVFRQLIRAFERIKVPFRLRSWVRQDVALWCFVMLCDGLRAMLCYINILCKNRGFVGWILMGTSPSMESAALGAQWAGSLPTAWQADWLDSQTVRLWSSQMSTYKTSTCATCRLFANSPFW